MKKYILFPLLLLMFLATAAMARDTLSGRVVNVADGDTITVLEPGNRQARIRLYGIDCPEKRQAFGQRAREFTTSRVAGQEVSVRIMDTDRYGRTVGVVRTKDGGIVNQELLANGFAWVYPQFCKASFCGDWKQDELRARQERLGLWQDKAPIEPWNFRKMSRRK